MVKCPSLIVSLLAIEMKDSASLLIGGLIPSQSITSQSSATFSRANTENHETIHGFELNSKMHSEETNGSTEVKEVDAIPPVPSRKSRQNRRRGVYGNLPDIYWCVLAK